MKLTRRQQEIYATLRDNLDHFEHPPTYDELCRLLGLSSRGSLHKHIQTLVQAGLIEPLEGQRRGIRLVEQTPEAEGIPFLGRIAAGKPIEAIAHADLMKVPDEFLGTHPCYVLQVSGDSMIEEGIFDGDYVIIEQQETARNGEIVVALVNNEEVTLKKIEQKPGRVVLYPANSEMAAMIFEPDQIQIQGVLRGLLRSYR